MTQEMLKGMDADGRAKMEELLKNVRTKRPAGSGGLFGALLVHGPLASEVRSSRYYVRQPCAGGNHHVLRRFSMTCWQVARAAARSLSTSRTC